MKQIWVLVLWLFISGCALQRAKVDLPDIQKSQGVVLKDLRPEQEKEREQFSYIVSSSAYGIFRIPELALDPIGTRILQHRVFEKFSANTKEPITLIVHHFVIYGNGQGAERRAAMGIGIGGAVGGLLGGAIGSAIIASGPTSVKTDTFFGTTVDPRAFDALAKNEYERAYVSAVEAVNDRTASFYVIYLDAEVNGSRRFIKTVSPASYNPNKDALSSAVQASVAYFVK